MPLERDELMRFLSDMEAAALGPSERADLNRDPDLRPLNWDQLRVMAARNVEIGSHSKTHCIISRCGHDSMRDELEDSKTRIATEVGQPCSLFAYPNGAPGDFSGASRRLLIELGYSCALTTVFGLLRGEADLFTAPRVGVSRRDSIHVFRAKLAGVWWQRN